MPNRKKKTSSVESAGSSLKLLERSITETQDLIHHLTVTFKDVEARIKTFQSEVKSVHEVILPRAEILLKIIEEKLPEGGLDSDPAGSSSSPPATPSSKAPAKTQSPPTLSSPAHPEEPADFAKATERCDVRKSVFWKPQQTRDHRCDPELYSRTKASSIEVKLREAETDEEVSYILGEELLEAVEDGREKDVLQLLEKGADIHYCSLGGWTPLLRAVHFGQVKVVELLLEKGADVNDRGGLDEAVLHLTVFKVGNPCVSLLARAGADVHARNDFGDTPLHAAACLGNARVALELLGAGAVKTLRNKFGETPFDVATGHGLRRILKF